jgi:drug/metabolite transporter (DMT)-like permease
MQSKSDKALSNIPLVIGLLTLYWVWGSTYLAIRVAVQTLPPFLMSGTRFLVAAAILFALIAVTRGIRMTWRQFFSNALIGAMMLLGGNGLVCWAEQEVASGVATLIVSMSPLCLVLLDWLVLHFSRGKLGEKPTGYTFLGITIGGCGLLLLIGPELFVTSQGSASWVRLAALLAACGFWSAGSLITRYSKDPLEPVTGAGAQMLWGGIWLVISSYLLGELKTFQLGSVSRYSLFAWLYLVVAGSIIAYTTYVWLMKHYSPTIVSTYGYINPVVAVVLGWWILDERLDSRIFASSAIIIVGVAVISRSRQR